MKTFMRFTFAFVTAVLLIGITACETNLTQIDKKPAESALAVLSSFSKIIMTVDDGLIPDSTGKGGMKILGQPYTETITGDFPNKVYTWDFGTEGDFQGILKLTLTDEYNKPGAVITAAFENFLHKGKVVDGVFTFENLGKSQDENDQYGFSLDNVKVGDNHLTAGWLLERTEGGQTPVQSDDIFTITQLAEAAEGKTDEGNAFTLNITKGLVLDLTCEYILTKGAFEVISKGTTLSADFGEGECDNLVKTSNGLVKADIFF